MRRTSFSLSRLTPFLILFLISFIVGLRLLFSHPSEKMGYWFAYLFLGFSVFLL